MTPEKEALFRELSSFITSAEDLGRAPIAAHEFLLRARFASMLTISLVPVLLYGFQRGIRAVFELESDDPLSSVKIDMIQIFGTLALITVSLIAFMRWIDAVEQLMASFVAPRALLYSYLGELIK